MGEELIVLSPEDQAALRAQARNTCAVCGEQAEIQIFRETGVCSEAHRKLVATHGVPDRPKALTP